MRYGHGSRTAPADDLHRLVHLLEPLVVHADRFELGQYRRSIDHHLRDLWDRVRRRVAVHGLLRVPLPQPGKMQPSRLFLIDRDDWVQYCDQPAQT